MKCIIAGSRDCTDIRILEWALDTCSFYDEITEIVSGGASGADYLGEMLSYAYSLKLTRFPAHWDLYGKRAGYLRNKEMAQYADGLIALWDGKSKGTQHMIKLATEYKLKLCIYQYEKHF